MGAKRFLIAGLVGIATVMPSMAQVDIDDEISDFGLWTSVGVEKKLTKKWGVELEGELRTQDAMKEVSRYSLGVSTDYKLTSWLKVDAGYVFLRDYNLSEFKADPIAEEDEGWVAYQGDLYAPYWTTRHRANVSLTGSVKLGRFKLSLRERWQYTYRPETEKGHEYHIGYCEGVPVEPVIEVGVLHDVAEDTEWTFDALLAEGFPVYIVDALRCVTKLSDDEPYDEFIERVKTNPLAVAVKINDLTDNMDVRRYKELSDWDVKRLKKYLKAYQELTK